MNIQSPHLFFACVLSLAACGGDAEIETASSSSETTGADVAAAPTSEAPDADPIAEALTAPHRSADNRARDPYRHPGETLAFFGLEPDMNVVEMGPGGGWYTEILAPVLAEEGQLSVAIAPETSEYTQRLLTRFSQDPEVFAEVERVTFEPPEQLSLGADASADMVLTFRSTHGWINRGQAEDVYAAMFRVLKPGGVLGVLQHRANEGVDVAASAQTGYVPQSKVVELATAAGFVLEESSDINANPQDDHDHPEGVWTLPPSLRLGDTDRAEWEAIGESDRMTLRFRKPE